MKQPISPHTRALHEEDRRLDAERDEALEQEKLSSNPVHAAVEGWYRAIRITWEVVS